MIVLKIFGIIIGLALLWVFAFFLYCRKQNKKKRVLEYLNLTLPKSWKELSEKQFLYVCNLMLWENTPTEIQTKCFLFFAGITVQEYLNDGTWICIHNKKRFTISDYEVQYFAKKLSFLTDTITEVNPLQEMAGFKHINPRFEGCPFKQWMAAENYYQAFVYTKQDIHLDKLCAVVYSSGIDFNDADTIKRSKAFKKVPMVQKLTVFIMYAGLKDRLSKEFSHFFQRVAVKSDQESARKPPKMREHFSNMIYVLNGGNVGETDKVLNAECWRAFDTLNRKAHENQEMEQRIKKLKKK
ncbi:hypothetical protein D0T84_16195 [Dysgonomonas sp. 521]|uniref:hypothetical protein n=1 Tax=Dysgonomonas sp. 521 TaxID=2302932 RepID=UPI0013D77330|nr:hypothetical protein [Dysgonomonas sp. 521]NDV96442.1 hypothetical protein [Dysgonomonas sp. 521]